MKLVGNYLPVRPAFLGPYHLASAQRQKLSKEL